MSAAESIETFDYLYPTETVDPDGVTCGKATLVDETGEEWGQEISPLLSQPLTGLTVLVTGEVPGYNRAEAQAAVERMGGKPVGSVSRSTGLVVVGEGAGVSKMAKARSFGLVGLLAAEFAALDADPATWHPARLRRVAVLDDLLDPPAADRPSGSGTAEDVDAAAGVVEACVAVGPQHLVGQTVVWPEGVREVRRSCFCGHRWLAESIAEPLCCPRAGEPFAETVDLSRLGRKPAVAEVLGS